MSDMLQVATKITVLCRASKATGLSLLGNGLCLPFCDGPSRCCQIPDQGYFVDDASPYVSVTCLCLVKSVWAWHFRLAFCVDPILAIVWI